MMKKNLRDDVEHCKKCHERWSEKLNRDMSTSSYKDEWYTEQCGNCAYFIGLIGYLSNDYGVCSNPKSKFDGKVRFEHDGCDSYVTSDEWN